jgi:hypothetical protein
MIVVPPRRCWVWVGLVLMIERRVFVPLPDPNEPTKGILHYLITGYA